MLLKKFLMLYFVFLVSIIYCDEDNLSKFYLKKAYEYYNSNEYELSKTCLIKAFEFSKKYPEYYYISNLILPNNKNTMLIKKKNTDNILNYLNNSFLIDNYLLLVQSANIYKEVRNFRKSLNVFNQVFGFKDKNLLEDYIACIDMLYKTNQKEFQKIMPEMINKARNLYTSLDFEYYSILYNIVFNNFKENEFNVQVSILSANNYSPSKIIYLKVLYFNDVNSLLVSYNQYENLKNKDIIDAGYKKAIVFELLKKSKYLGTKEKLSLLNDWRFIGNDDFKTESLLKDNQILTLIKRNKDLANSLVNYTGIRRLDNDIDGEWEEYYEYKNGIVVKKIIDENQDGIFDVEALYFDNGELKEYLIYKNTNDNYNKFIFNYNDQSLVAIEKYISNKLIERTTLLSSNFYPKEAMIKDLSDKQILPFIAYKEELGDEYTYTSYNDSTPRQKLINYNRSIDKILQKKIYKDGELIEVLKDNNGNGNYEICEKYQKGKISQILAKTNDSLLDYDYKEQILSDRTIKYWDNNHDGKFEIAIEELNNGIIYKKFDIDFDGEYDYIYETKNNKNNKIYKVVNGKEILFKEYQKAEKQNKQDWTIVTAKNLDQIKIPDVIMFDDYKNLSGTFIYNHNKSFFKNGIIKTSDFDYRLLIINNVIYLFELY